LNVQRGEGRWESAAARHGGGTDERLVHDEGAAFARLIVVPASTNGLTIPQALAHRKAAHRKAAHRKAAHRKAAMSTPMSFLSQRLLTILIVGTITIVVVSASASWLNERARRVRLDEAPLQRIPKNAPFITSPDIIVNRMIEMAKITDRDLVYDLGCGDGRIVISAAVQRGCQGVGFDIDPQRVAEARANARLHEVEDLVMIEERDIFTLDFREADVIMMYLLPWMLEKLIPQLENCPPGTRIVSHDFRIEGIQEDQEAVIKLERETKYVYLYVTPLKKSSVQRKWKNWKDPAGK
jgi:SAM-dependent methyltransferase